MHYLVTDRVTSPSDYRGCYSEALLLLPGTTYLISDHAVSRREALPAPPPAARAWALQGRAGPGEPLLCSFNQLYKLTPALWAAWMRVLRAAPRARLWLLEFDEAAVDSLLAAARREGVDPARVVPAPPR